MDYWTTLNYNVQKKAYHLFISRKGYMSMWEIEKEATYKVMWCGKTLFIGTDKIPVSDKDMNSYYTNLNHLKYLRYTLHSDVSMCWI